MEKRVEINITPMSLKNGVMGLPIDSCRHWDASQSVCAEFSYADIKAPIRFTPKHVEYIQNGDTVQVRAKAWQFTINNALQFAQLIQDGVYTYAEESTCGEKLICGLEETAEGYVLSVKDKELKPLTKATRKLQALLKQGMRPQADKESSAPEWNSPSGWIDFEQVKEYQDVNDCLYMWYGKKAGSNTTYLYVGIVGDTHAHGQSKRTLCQRLTEEEKQWQKAQNIHISKFRFCSLHNSHGFPIPELLKTVEMAEITIMTSLFFCENTRDGIAPLFKDQDIILLNKMTSFKYVK